VPETLHSLDWTLLATMGPLVIGELLIAWVIWKGRWRSGPMYALIVGFNEWVLKSFVREMEWKRIKVEGRRRLRA
jgi:hypothetical protein